MAPLLSSSVLTRGQAIVTTRGDIGFHTERLCVSLKDMSVGSKSNTGPAVLQRKPRRRRGIVPKGGKAFLGARDKKLHNQLKKDGSLKSGRAGAYVYYVRKGRQCWRRCVVPRDPRTPAQQRLRARFGAASKTWSADGTLTDEQRHAWYTQGTKTRSRKRLGTSGKLTGQQAFVGRNCAKGHREGGMLLDPHEREMNNPETKAHKPELIAKVAQSQRVTQSSSGTRPVPTMVDRCLRRGMKGHPRRGRNKLLTSEVASSYRLAQSTCDRSLTRAGALPMQRRRNTRHTPGALAILPC